MRNLLSERPMLVHPNLIDQVDDKEEALASFKDQLSKFKPKQSVLEQSIIKSQDFGRIGTFQDTLEIQRLRQEEKKARTEHEK